MKTLSILFGLFVLSAQAQQLVPGATLRTWCLEGDFQGIPRIVAGQTPNVDRLIRAIDLSGDDLAGGVIYSRVSCFLDIAEAGSFRFRLTSDDGSRLSIDGKVVCDNDGRHGMVDVTSDPVALAAGRHAVLVEHFDAGGSRGLVLEWCPAGVETFAVMNDSVLLAEEDPTRLTSPGIKRVVGQRRPGDRRPLLDVHPSYRLETARPADFEPRVGSLALLEDGRLLVGTFNPLQRDEIKLPDIESKSSDSVWAVSGFGEGELRAEEVITGVFEPAGLCVVETDVYVAHRKAVTRFRDLDGDGVFEDRHDVASGWEGWNYHQFTAGLVHRDGKLYTALTTTMAPPAWEGMGTNAAPCGPMRGSILEIDLASERPRVIAGGLRTPNGLGEGPSGTLLCLDNQGTWMPTNQLVTIVPGRFYGHYNRTNVVPRLSARFPAGGHPSTYCDRPRTQPALWMPQNEVSNSPTQPALLTKGPFAGQVLIGDVTAGGLRRVFLECIAGQWQGAMFRHSQGFEGGINRLVQDRDGVLYIGCIGAGGNWNWRGRQFGLQRLIPVEASPFEMESVRITSNGLMVSFTEEVDQTWLANSANFGIQQWGYEPDEKYGGPKVDVETLPVTAARPSEDGRTVTLTIPGMMEERCVHLVTDPVSRSGRKIRSTEAWYTVLRVPRDDERPAGAHDEFGCALDDTGVGVPPPSEATVLLGQSRHGAFKRKGQSRLPRDGRRRQDDLMSCTGEVALDQLTGDLVTACEFGDCRLHVEWIAPPGGEGQRAGNSGVYLQGRYEVQVLGTPAGQKGLASDEAGALYGQKAADTNASTGPGTWQAYDIRFRAPRFSGGKKIEDARISVHWNGVLVHDDVTLPNPTGQRSGAAESPTGPLLLQHHGHDAKGPVRFRNVWIAPLESSPVKEGPWRPLFSEDLSHYEVTGGTATFERREETIVGITRPNTPNTFLTTKRDFDDFELEFEVKCDAELNSGVQIRSEILPNSGGLRGYQVEIDPRPRAYSGGVYDQSRRGWLAPLIDKPYARRAWRTGQWNRIEVRALGPVLRTWVNGVPAGELFDALSPSGRIGLQVHDVGPRKRPLEVHFKNLRIRELQMR